MRIIRNLALLAAGAALATSASAKENDARAGTFAWSTRSAEARQLLTDLQERIESFQFGPENAAIARKMLAADPGFAMAAYYVAATTQGDERAQHLRKAVELAPQASDGERRFIQAMKVVFDNQGADFAQAIEPMAGLARDYPGERFVWIILGQLHNGAGQGDQAATAFRRARDIGPRSLRVDAFLAGHQLLEGDYAGARAAYQAIEKDLPRGSVPFNIRYGTTFSHLYEGNVDAALKSLEGFLEEYRASGSTATFPEVFIWNSMARIQLEHGRLDKAMSAYKEGYKSVPESGLPEDQKTTWLGRLRHGQARVLAKMGRHEEAWAQVQTVKQMIDTGGEPAKQFLPAYHYLAGYCKLEAGELEAAVQHLTQADPDDPFHRLLLGRAYERLGRKDEARKAFDEVVKSKTVNIERALSYPEAKRKLATLS